MSLKRYSMFPALPGPIKFEQPVQETQKKELREPKNRLRRGTASVIVDDRHLRLQKALIKLLKEHYGEEHVFAERKSIDIAVRKDKQSLLIEIKSDFEVKSVIRQALGQVIEYAHWPTRNEKYETFVIVAPAAENEESRKYLAFLRDRYRIPILYCSFSVGNSLPSALRQKIVARQQ